MPTLSGKCLCGNIQYSADTDIKLMANCHCTDCRAATGAAYGTLVFVEEDALQVTGTPKVFHHKVRQRLGYGEAFLSGLRVAAVRQELQPGEYGEHPRRQP